MAEESQKQHPVDLYALLRVAFDAHAKMTTLASTLLAMSDAKIRDNAQMGQLLTEMAGKQAEQIAERDKRIEELERVHAMQVEKIENLDRHFQVCLGTRSG